MSPPHKDESSVQQIDFEVEDPFQRETEGERGCGGRNHG